LSSFYGNLEKGFRLAEPLPTPLGYTISMRKVIVSSEPTPYSISITTGVHGWTSDEPKDLGGQDEGPTPYELLLSSIGACTAITAQMYANRKKWPLEGITVELDHQKLKAEDCPDCKTEKGQVSEITVKVSITGDLSDEQRKRILEISGKCPVKKTVEGEVIFRPELVTNP